VAVIEDRRRRPAPGLFEGGDSKIDESLVGAMIATNVVVEWDTNAENFGALELWKLGGSVLGFV
jgi:hypothetical protein